jgi:hypothetical protein
MGFWKKPSDNENNKNTSTKRRVIRTYVGRKKAAPPIETRPVPAIWKKLGQQ